MTFSILGLSKRLLACVEQVGYHTATPIQQQAIPEILAGHDVMAGAQTGTGKTAAFALPILDRLEGQETFIPHREDKGAKAKALVLTPTRELAQQVFNSFLQYGNDSQLRILLAYGGVSLNPQIDQLRKGADIIVATPGRLIDHLFKGTINLSELQFLVFDEADRMLDMGFISEINRILKRVPDKRQTLLFSATFDDAIFKLSHKLLTEPKLIEVDQRNAAADKVVQAVYQIDADRKREFTSFLIGSKNWQQVLIFVRTKQGADALVKEMNKDGIKTQAIHGDKSQGARERALTEFKQHDIRVLVATDVAARGLDIPSLDYVINYELPHIAEDYVHRIGRTGRAGNEGLAISLMSEDEAYLLEEVEVVIDDRLAPQWYPGFEPDLTKSTRDRKNSKQAQKRRTKQRAAGKETANSRKKQTNSSRAR